MLFHETNKSLFVYTNEFILELLIPFNQRLIKTISRFVFASKKKSRRKYLPDGLNVG